MTRIEKLKEEVKWRLGIDAITQGTNSMSYIIEAAIDRHLKDCAIMTRDELEEMITDALCTDYSWFSTIGSFYPIQKGGKNATDKAVYVHPCEEIKQVRKTCSGVINRILDHVFSPVKDSFTTEPEEEK